VENELQPTEKRRIIYLEELDKGRLRMG